MAKTNWKLPFFGLNYKTFKDGVSGTLSGSDQGSGGPSAAVVSSARVTTLAHFLTNLNNFNEVTGVGLISYSGSGSPSAQVTVTLSTTYTNSDNNYGPWCSLCTDGTHFYASGMSVAGNLTVYCIAADGTIVWTQAAGGLAWGHTPSTVNFDIPGFASCAAAGVLYVNAPQSGVYRLDTSDGTALGQLISAGSIATGSYINGGTGEKGGYFTICIAGNVLAVPVVAPTTPSWGGYWLTGQMGIRLVNATTGAVIASNLGLTPAASEYMMNLVTDGTNFYGFVCQNGTLDPTIYKFSATDATTTWSASPFSNHNVSSIGQLMYISGSKQLVAAITHQTSTSAALLINTSDGTTVRTPGTPFNTVDGQSSMADAGAA